MKKQIFRLCSAFAIIPLLFCACSDNDTQGDAVIELSRVKNVAYVDAEFEMIVSGSGVTSKGFCWGTTPNPTISGTFSKSTDERNGRATGYIGGLQADTKYYARAFITTGGNTVYGPQIEFRTFVTGSPISAVIGFTATAIQANVEASVMTDGGKEVTARGVCYSTNHLPTVEDIKVEDTGRGLGSFNVHLTGLTSETSYCLRTYAVTDGVVTYGNEFEFKTTPYGDPSVELSVVKTDVLAADLKLNVINLTEDIVTEIGVCYSITANPTTADNKQAVSGTGKGEYAIKLESLEKGTQYYVRPYVIGVNSGTYYGPEITMSTLNDTPYITTSTAVTFLGWGATVGGTLVNVGGLSGEGVVSETGVCWSASPNPTISDNKMASTVKTPGSFTLQTRPAAQGVKYYVRAYATNQYGTSYGNQIEYTSRKVYGGQLLPGAAGQTSPLLNALNYTVAAQTGPGTPSAFQADMLTKVAEAVNATNGVRVATGIRFYFNTDTNGGTVAYWVINYTSGATAYEGRHWFKVTQNSDGQLIFGSDYIVSPDNGNMTTLLNALASKPDEKAKIQAVLDWLTSAPLVIDWISGESDTVYSMYHPATPNDYIRATHFNVTGFAPVTAW